MQAPANAVLDDEDLKLGLHAISEKFGDECIRIAGEAWGQPLIPQKVKAFLAMAVDVANQGPSAAGSAFRAHLAMAVKQGATEAEVEELLTFLCAYCGVNKLPHFFASAREAFRQGPAS